MYKKHGKYKEYRTKRLNKKDLAAVMSLQDKVFTVIKKKQWLSENDILTMKALLKRKENHCYGVFDEERNLVAAGFLHTPKTKQESLKKYFTNDFDIDETVNMKLVLVSPDNRREKLGQLLVDYLTDKALQKNIKEIICTVHSRNKPSRKLFEKMGYRKTKKVHTAYGERLLYVKKA